MIINSIKKLVLLLSIVALVVTGVIPLASVVNAAGVNLVANPSTETANSTNTAPLSWNKGGWGTNTSTLTYPNGGANTGTKSLLVSTTSYTSGDAKWYFNDVAVKTSQKYTYTESYKSNVATDVTIQYTSTTGVLSYVWLGNLVASTTSYTPVSFSFTTPTNAKSLTVFHTLNKVGWLQTDDFSLTDDTGVTPPPTTAPTITIGSPLNNATVSGTAQTINATATTNTTGVQFKIDGVNLGSEDTAAPFATAWNTTVATNGSHTISATARNSSGQTATASVAVNVQNSITPPPVPQGSNLIANPSFETTSNNTSPDSWQSSSWGTNTASYTYLSTGRTGGKSVKASVSGYSSGAANWHHANTPVSPGKTYSYENWYKSNVVTEIDAAVTLSNGTIQYVWLGTIPASSVWAKTSATLTAPIGAVSVSFFQPLAKNGYVITDDYSLKEDTPVSSGGFSRAVVSLTFDDGWRSIHTNGLPLLKKYGMVSTQYVNSEPIMGGWSDYMSYQMVKDFYSQGSELGWHTRSHANLTTLSSSGLTLELSIPSAFLGGLGLPSSVFTNFATPYGAYNATVTTGVRKYYASNRNTDTGYNSKSSFNINNIKVQNITNTTTQAQVQSWVNQAISGKSWLVLVYHEVTANAADPTYAVTPANLDLQLNYIKQSGISVQTVQQALNEIKAQQ